MPEPRRPKSCQKDNSTGSRRSDTRCEFIHRVFAALDKHENGRLTREDVRHAAEQYGLDITRQELNDMIRFWDNSGTATLSYNDFVRICDEAGL
jgi:Ca2+-binding EF-hand superfamily protein